MSFSQYPENSAYIYSIPPPPPSPSLTSAVAAAGSTSTDEPLIIPETPPGRQQSVDSEAVEAQIIISFHSSENDSQGQNGIRKPYRGRKGRPHRDTSLDKYLLEWITEFNIPMEAISSKNFNLLMGTTSNRLKLVAQVSEKHKRLKQEVIKQLARIESKIHLSINLRTHGGHVNVDGIAAHFVDVSTKEVAVLPLDVPWFEGSHSSKCVAGRIIDVINEFEIQGKLGCFVIPDPDRYDKYFEPVADEFGFQWHERRLHCVGHVIDTIAETLLGWNNALLPLELPLNSQPNTGPQSATRVIHDVIDKLRKVIRQVNDPYIPCDAAPRRQLGIGRFLLDDPGDWRLTYAMILEAVESRESIDTFHDTVDRLAENPVEPGNGKPEDKSRNTRLSSDEWDILKKYLWLLKPLKELSDSFEGRPSQGEFLSRAPAIVGVDYILRKLKEYMDQNNQHLGQTERQRLNCRVELSHEKAKRYLQLGFDSPIHIARIALDPRLKWKYIPEYLVTENVLLRSAEEKLKGLWREYETLPNKPREIERRYSPENFLAFIERNIRGIPKEDDLKAWEHCDPEPIDTNPIFYWIEESKGRPRLAHMAYDVYSIPTTIHNPKRVTKTQNTRKETKVVRELKLVQSWVGHGLEV